MEMEARGRENEARGMEMEGMRLGDGGREIESRSQGDRKQEPRR
jgi:hypothetical protein